MIRLLIAEPRDLVRIGLKSLLPRGTLVVAEALHGAEVVAKASLFEPDALIVADDLPGTDLVGALRLIRERLPDASILILTDQADPEFLHTIRELGAGYLSRGASAKVITSTVAALPSASSIDNGDSRAHHKDVGLSPAQLRVAQLVVEGLKTREIAKILGVTERTVGAHRSEVMKRLGVKTSAAIAKALIERKYQTPRLPRGKAASA